jgi:hypothetical protein
MPVISDTTFSGEVARVILIIGLSISGTFCFSTPSQLIGSSLPQSACSPVPPAHFAMTPIRGFVGTLTVARKSFKEIEENVKSVYGDKALRRL